MNKKNFQLDTCIVVESSRKYGEPPKKDMVSEETGYGLEP